MIVQLEYYTKASVCSITVFEDYGLSFNKFTVLKLYFVISGQKWAFRALCDTIMKLSTQIVLPVITIF